MRFVIRYILLNVCIVCFLGFIELLLIQAVFSSPAKMKTLLTESHVYQDLSLFINQKLKESDEPVPLTVTESLLRPVVERFIDDAWAWGSGKTSVPPSISLPDIVQSTGITGMDKTEIAALQKEFTTMLADPSMQKELPPEAKESLEKIKQFTNNNGTVSLTPLLTFIKVTVQLFRIGIPVLGVLSFVSLLLIVLISQSNGSRAMWVFFTFFLSALSFIIVAVIFAVPKVLLPFLLTQMHQEMQYGEGIFTAIVGPLSNTLYHQNIAVAVGMGTLALICLLARVMVFHDHPAAVVQAKIEKKQKIV